MGWNGAMRSRRSVALLRRVIAIEFLCAAQAIELRAPLRPAPATGAMVAELRSAVAHLDEDRFLGSDIAAADEWVRGRVWERALKKLHDCCLL